MEKAVLWCKLAASFSVVSSILSLLIPGGGVKKTFQTLLTLILIFSLIHPLRGNVDYIAEFSDKVDFVNFSLESDVGKYKDTALKYTAENEVANYIITVLSGKGINCTCDVICEYKDDVITVGSVTVNGCKDKSKKEYIEKIIRDTVDGDYEIIFSGE